MKPILVFAALCSLVAVFEPSLRAESASQKSRAKEKSPADVAIEQLSKLRADAIAKPGEQKFQAFIDASVAWIKQYPTNSRAPGVIRTIGLLPMDLKKEDRAQRGVFSSRLQYKIVDAKFQPDTSEDAKTALAALDATAAEAVTRDAPTRDNLQTWREKIDTLTTRPDSGRFVVDAERSYFDVLTRGVSATAGEKHLRRLLEHPDKSVGQMAQDELNLVELKKAPLAYTFTALDGTQVDCAKYQGKVLAVVFWSAADAKSHKQVEALRDTWSDIRRSGFDVVVVSTDGPDGKDSLTAAIKNLKLSWPVAYDGSALEHPLGKKLNVRKVPTVALFDKNGMLVASGLDPTRASQQAKLMLGIQDQPRESSGGGRRGRR